MSKDRAPEAAPSTLIDLLRWRAAWQPQLSAYTFLTDGKTEAESLTYAELDRHARAVAALLQSYKAAGERVLLLYPAGLEYIAAFFGCLYAGAIAVPVYPPRVNQSLARLRSIVADAQATIALTTTEVLPRLKPMIAAAPELEKLCWLETDVIPGGLTGEWLEPAVDSQTLAFLQYTSGSTAAPKGVMVSHGNLLNNQGMIQRTFRQTDESIILSWLPLYHDMGLIGNVIHPLFVGAQCILMSPVSFLQRPLRWLRAISSYKATTSGGPNFAYELCARKVPPEERATLDLSSWRVAFVGAEPVRPETLDRFARAFEPCGFRRQAFGPCYGLAEATLLVTGASPPASPVLRTVQADALQQGRIEATAAEDEGALTIVGCGRAQWDQKLAIVDPESLTCCPPDRVGEIWLSGPSVAAGYWNHPEETVNTFGAYLADTGEGPFLRTGDLGFIRDGELFVTGRLKDLIIVAGRNHYPQDIELTVEQSHPSAVRPGCCAAFSVEIEGEGRLVVAAEVERRYKAKPGQPPVSEVESVPASGAAAAWDAVTLVKAIRQAVAEQHDLSVYQVVLLKAGTIPKTSSGKIQRHACRAGFLAGSLELWGGA